ncbi:MAG TPA: monodechloroaminopyrrolnitrin synthase PrnB family protein, partial [Gaiellaceae bacterium]
LFMRPEDQASLRDCMRRRSFLDQFVDAIDESRERPWFQRNAREFIRVCEAHGRVAAQHHDQLVARFIAAPASALDESHLAQVTASGPPLPVLLAALEVLRDLRLAAERDDIASRHAEMTRLRAAVAA